jgi:hypothetical protein
MGAKKKAETQCFGFFLKDLAATYSRGSYTTTTIGKTVFDGRVRDGNGSGHSFIATKKMIKRTCWKRFQEYSLKTTHRRGPQPNSRVEIAFLSRAGKKAIKPHDRLVLVR